MVGKTPVTQKLWDMRVPSTGKETPTVLIEKTGKSSYTEIIYPFSTDLEQRHEYQVRTLQ